MSQKKAPTAMVRIMVKQAEIIKALKEGTETFAETFARIVKVVLGDKVPKKKKKKKPQKEGRTNKKKKRKLIKVKRKKEPAVEEPTVEPSSKSKPLGPYAQMQEDIRKANN